jgi:hypothetical protein
MFQRRVRGVANRRGGHCAATITLIVLPEAFKQLNMLIKGLE